MNNWRTPLLLDILSAAKNLSAVTPREYDARRGARKLEADALGPLVEPVFRVLCVVVPIDRLVFGRELLDRRKVGVVDVLDPVGDVIDVRRTEETLLQLGPGTLFDAP